MALLAALPAMRRAGAIEILAPFLRIFVGLLARVTLGDLAGRWNRNAQREQLQAADGRAASVLLGDDVLVERLHHGELVAIEVHRAVETVFLVVLAQREERPHVELAELVLGAVP